MKALICTLLSALIVVIGGSAWLIYEQQKQLVASQQAHNELLAQLVAQTQMPSAETLAQQMADAIEAPQPIDADALKPEERIGDHPEVAQADPVILEVATGTPMHQVVEKTQQLEDEGVESIAPATTPPEDSAGESVAPTVITDEGLDPPDKGYVEAVEVTESAEPAETAAPAEPEPIDDRWETYGPTVETIIGDLLSGRYAKVTARFSPEFAAAFLPQTAQEAMQRIHEKHGRLVAITSHKRHSQFSLPADQIAYRVSVQTERESGMVVTITLDSAKRITALFIKSNG